MAFFACSSSACPLIRLNDGCESHNLDCITTKDSNVKEEGFDLYECVIVELKKIPQFHNISYEYICIITFTNKHV